MKLKFCHYIILFFLFFSLDGISAQDLSLTLAFKNKNELQILNTIEYQKKHKDTTNLYIEVNRISDYLKNLGYFTNTIDSVKKLNKDYTVYYSLNEKIDLVKLNIDAEFSFLFDDLKSETATIPIKDIQSTLSDISKKLDNQGKSFSKVQLKNIIIKNKVLFADLDIHQSKKRFLDKIIVKGYENFPKSFLKNYYNINKKTIFNQQKIKTIANSTKSLQFVEEIKPSEVLFTKDSTLLYLYLKKKQNNSFDGIVNFASKEDGGVLFNGTIDLKLNNVLNKGEKFELFWNSIAEERQEFKLLTETPYIFNSKFTPQISFSIYRQDSSFLNTKFNSELFYNLSTKAKISINYNSESSENLEDNISSTQNIETFSNYFVGFKFQYRIPKNDFFFNDTFFFEINPTLGRRTSQQNSSNQFKLETSTSYIYDINTRNSISIKNTTGILYSETLLNNELFRIGGPNSIRGFNEQSIFTDKFTVFNLEYRYLTSSKSYFHSITDIGLSYFNNQNDTFIGFGLGYSFSIKNSVISFSIANNKKNRENINFNKTQIILNWNTIF